ncbi:MAG: DNA recombination protein RmuC [Chitinophagaceae bacterium]
MPDILYWIIALLAGVIIGWLLGGIGKEKKFVPRSQAEQLRQELSQSRQDMAGQTARAEQWEKRAQDLLNENRQLLAQLRDIDGSLQRSREENRQILIRLQEQQQSLEQVGKKFESEFRVLAQNILEEKTKTFHQSQENSLGQLLNPLRDQLRNFKEEFENRYKTESNERISLREQIRHMLDLNQTLSTQAENLTRALTNNVKSQGDWGESILESILQYAGLQKDLHYVVQASSQNEAGETIRPDVIIKYPDGRALVVDSKVSLLHYTRWMAATEEVERKSLEGLMLQSFRQHADGLSRKNYQSVADALDFVLMFVPVESAYILALQTDPTLWQYAYQKRVLLISPTNLIPAMKLVADLWQRDGISRHATAIAERAGKLYDKLVGFVDNFDKVGSQLDKATETWREAQKQLAQGRGNLISQAEKMREMHIKTSKKLPPGYTEQAQEEEDEDENL